MPKAPQPQKGSLILVVMCLLAVLGIALASYLAVSNQSMTLSNRAYATDVSRQLAEMGLERALRSFQASTFSSWTLSGNTATQTLTTSSSPSLPTTYGSSGIIPKVYLRVDNYRDTTKAVPWSVLTTYALNDYVWYQGVWYICISAPTANQDPSDTTYWTAAPAPWSSIANYRSGNIVTLAGNAYQCILANVNTTPPNTTYWTPKSPAATTWSSATTYAVDDVVFSGGMSYRCISAHLNHAPPNTTYWLSAPVIYSEGVATLPDSAGTTIKTQLRALVAPASLFPNAAGATTLVNLASSGTVDSYDMPSVIKNTWSSTKAYSVGDSVAYNPTGLTYRCIAAHTNQLPTNTSSWTVPATGHAGWSSASVAYKVDDLVYYQPNTSYPTYGLLYRCVADHTSDAAKNPSNTTYWALETTSSTTWSSSTSYVVGDLAYSAGSVYVCILAHSNQAPPNATYWALLDSYSVWGAGTTYRMHQIVYSGTTLYRCVNAPPVGQAVTDTNYWSTTMPAYSFWLSNTSYSSGTMVYYAPTGLLYRYGYAQSTSGNAPTTSFPYWTSPFWTYLGPGHSSWSSTVTYSTGYLVYYPVDGGLYRYSSSTSTSGNAPGTSYWTRIGAGYQGWASGLNYSSGDVVYYSPTGSLYRYFYSTATNGNLPTNTTYWSSTLSGCSGWSAATTYSSGDIVYYPTTGLFYRYGNATSTSGNLPTNTTYWFLLGSGSTSWLPATSYSVGDVVYYSVNGISYRCISAHTSTIAIIPTNTTYWSPTMPGYSAVLAGSNTSGTAVTVTTATVKGYVAAPGASTSPYAPRWTYGAATLTGSSATGIDLTRVSRSPYVPQFDIQTIAAGGGVTLNSLTVPSSGTLALPRTTDTISSDGKYYYYTTAYLYLGTCTLSIHGPVVIDVQPTGSSGHIVLDSTGRIVVTNNATASLEIHFGGELYIGTNGGGGIHNLTMDPKRCILLGTNTTNTSGYHYFWSNVPFYGVIYMPNAYLHMWNSGYTEHIYGALSAKNIYFNHTANLHYDTSLRTAVISGVDAPYLISEWRELTDPTEKVTLP